MLNRTLRHFALLAAVGAWSAGASGQNGITPPNSERDIIVTDFDGHVIVRFAGAAPGELDQAASDEIGMLLAAEKVPEELDADLRFEDERVDSDWATETARLIRRHVLATGPGFAEIHVECRSSSCRLHLYEANRFTVLEHQIELGRVQPVIAAFIADNTPEFEPVFLMAAYARRLETPFIRVILQRQE